MASTRSPLSADPDDDTGRAPLTSWYTQGVADGFGDRLLMFDNAATGPIELLRVRRDLAAVPGFESALRARFAQLTAFTHSGFAQARVVNHLDNGGGLTVASTHVTGTRLSALFEASRPSPGMHPGAVREVFGDLVSAIGDLHKVGGGIAHGALSADRIILTFDRRLIVSDYVFGAALERLHLPASRLWTDFGLFDDEPRRTAARAEAQRLMRDFSRIRTREAGAELFTPDDAAAIFQRHAAWLQRELAREHAGETVVITHHAPTRHSIHPRFADSLLNACFVSDAEHLLRAGRVALWVHGHTHDSFDHRVHGTRVVCNPRGYARGGVNENAAFDPDFCVELGASSGGR